MNTKSKTPKYSASFEARVSFNHDIRQVESATLDDRKAGFADWLDALQNDPDVIVDRIEWLLDGNYGFGSYDMAREVITHTRMNRPAWLGQTIAALEWQCPNDYARKAWNKLSDEQKGSLTAKINAVIESALEAMAEEAQA